MALRAPTIQAFLSYEKTTTQVDGNVDARSSNSLCREKERVMVYCERRSNPILPQRTWTYLGTILP